MIKRITLSHILLFLILSSAVDAQSSLPSPLAPFPNATLPNRVPHLDPTVVVLVCVFFLVGCLAVFLHHWSNILLSQSATTANFHSTQPQGIDPQLLNTFPILPCSAVKQLKFGSAAAPECAVCLAEYDDHDQLRLLPKCHHAFHSECIDAWLASHVTCPVCRARLKPVEKRHHGCGNDVVILIPS